MSSYFQQVASSMVELYKCNHTINILQQSQDGKLVNISENKDVLFPVPNNSLLSRYERRNKGDDTVTLKPSSKFY